VSTPKKKKAPARKPATKKPAAPETVLVLRSCNSDMRSPSDKANGFVWPASGPVEALDWKPTKECGFGLHGWLWGSGDWEMKSKDAKAKWLVVEVLKADIVDLQGKVKFQRGTVVSCSDHWRDAMAVIRARLLRTAGAVQQASADGEVASATGYSGHASATGDSGHASATGDYGHASATGNYGWAVVGYKGKAKADKSGVVSILWWDEQSKRPRVRTGYVGEDGVKAGQWYAANEKGALVEVSE
jgi:hypothetical protein